MDSAGFQKLLAIVVYMAGIIGIGVYFSKRANKNSENFFLGGRSLGPWVAAFSAEASDMSGWLLMGIPGFLSLTSIATPLSGKTDAFAAARPYGFFTILSTMAWGLGYFGVPQVLVRFMAIRSESELKVSRRVAATWVVISMLAAIFIGISGRSISAINYVSNIASENIFTDTAALYLPAFLAGIAAAGVIAASISSSDSYLLISAGAFSQSLYKGIFRKSASSKEVMICSRATLCVVTIIAMVIGWNSNSTIFAITSFAWAGLGAAFGPLMLFSLFHRNTTRLGAICGMVTGGIAVIIWKLRVKPLGGFFSMYELLPSFALSCLVIFIVSKFTKDEHEKEMLEIFDKVRDAAADVI